MAGVLGDYDRSRIPLWLAAIGLGLALTYVFYRFVGTFVLGLFVYYVTRPIHRRLSRIVRPSSLAAAVSLVTITLPVILLVAYTAYVGAQEFAAVAENANLTTVSEMLEPYLGGAGAGGDPRAVLSAAIEDPQAFVSGGVIDALQGALGPAAGYLGALGNGFIHLFVVFALAFYLLRDDHRLAAWFQAELAGEGTSAYAYLDAVDRNLKTIYFGNILNAFAVAILAAVSYNALNATTSAAIAVPSPTLVGLLTGVGSLVPVIGMKVVYVPVALALAAQAPLQDPTLLWFPAVFALVSFVIVDTIPDLILRPYVSGRALHTGSVMVAYILGPLIWGWYGLFLGPLLLVAVVHFARIVLPELVRGEPVTTAAAPGNPLDPDDDVPAEEPDPVDHEGTADSGVEPGDDAHAELSPSDTDTTSGANPSSDARSRPQGDDRTPEG